MFSEVEIKEILEDFEACERAEFNIHTLAHGIARRMVERNDLGQWERLPDKVKDAVMLIAEVYRRDGTVVSRSSIGVANHDNLGASLMTLFNTKFGEEWGRSGKSD